MADVIALPWASDLAVATPTAGRARAAGLERLPAEWVVVDGVTPPAGPPMDHVVVGPNGVFTVKVDGDAMAATVGDDGIYRSGIRVTTPVKHALLGAHHLRRALGEHVLAYPVLVIGLEAPQHRLDRLGVVPGESLAEHIWSHPGRPLRRSQRVELLWSLRRLSE